MTKYVKIRLDDDDHAGFRHALFDSGQTMQSRLEAFIRQDVAAWEQGKNLLEVIAHLNIGELQQEMGVELTPETVKLIEKAISGKPLSDGELALLAEKLNIDQRRLTRARDESRLVIFREDKDNVS